MLILLRYIDEKYCRSVRLQDFFWILFLQEFEVSLAWQREVHLVIGEFLIHLPLRKKGCFLRCVGVCAVIRNLWGERNNIVFRCVGREPCEVWSSVRFHVFLWALTLKTFDNYLLGKIQHSCSPFL